MGPIRHDHKVNLIAGLLSNDLTELSKARHSLARAFGRTDFESAITDFTHTEYYADEMGHCLKRQFLSFKKPIGLRDICRTKILTGRIERRLSSGGKRKVNIDPGYIDLSKLVLFSTKDFSHRIYLDKGIYAELTLMYRDRTFNPLPWTYPDYRTDEYVKLFNNIREMYKAKNP
jgi:hypothetical protein